MVRLDQLTRRQCTAAGRALRPAERHSRTGSQETSVCQDARTADGRGDKTVASYRQRRQDSRETAGKHIVVEAVIVSHNKLEKVNVVY